MQQYEKNKVELKNYLEHLDKRCKSHFGPLNKYDYPVENPYKTYTDLADFKKRELKNKTETEYIKLTKRCKFMSEPSKATDKQDRYYKDIRNKHECDSIKGFWDPAAINRDNKFDEGVCWKTKQDQVCGSHVTADSLRTYRSRFNPIAFTEDSNKCGQLKNCHYEHQTLFTGDCVKGAKAATSSEKEQGPVHEPPSQMPLEKFEIFLEDWYLKNKYGPSPKTAELLGKGDRCKGIIVDEVTGDATTSMLPLPPSKLPQYIDFRKLDPRKAEDADILKQHMTAAEFKKFKSQWVESHTYSDIVFKDDVVKPFYDKMDKQQFETDYKYAPLKLLNKPKFLPSIPQSVLNMVMKNIAIKKGSQRGMLAWHSTGSGKSAAAAGIMDAFWDTDKQIIFASSIAALASNPPYKFHELCMNFYGRFQMPPYKGSDDAQSLAIIAEAFKKRKVRFLSFAKLSNRVQKAIEYKKAHKLSGGKAPMKEKTHDEILASDDYVDLDKCVLIIDEVHNLFKPLPNQKQQHEFLEKELVDPKRHPNLKLVILTATPGDSIPEVMKLLNIIRRPTDEPITPPDITSSKDISRFKKQIRGMISYFDMSGDDTKFPVLYDSQPIKYPMSEIQYEKYLEAYKTLTALHKNYDALAKKNQISKYYEPVRKYSNMLFNFQKDMALNDFSSKLPHLLNKLQELHDTKHYIYSSFASRAGYGGHGVYAIAKELEKIGYRKLTVQEARKLKNNLPLPAKRYIMATNVDLGEDGNAGDNLTELLKIYNHPANKDGGLIHVMLASNKFNESIDLKDVSHMHFFEAFVDMASEKQALGRAVRYCSFANKNRANGEWKVFVHRYISDKPTIVPIDKGPIRQKIQDEINNIQEKIEQANNKEAVKSIQKAIKAVQTQMTKLEKQIEKGKAKADQLTPLQQEIKDLNKKLDEATDNFNNSQEIIKALKTELSEKKKELKLVDKPSKATANKDVDIIEEQIFQESKQRFKQLFTVYQCMKEGSIDCRLLNDFHRTTGTDIKCEF